MSGVKQLRKHLVSCHELSGHLVTENKRDKVFTVISQCV